MEGRYEMSWSGIRQSAQKIKPKNKSAWFLSLFWNPIDVNPAKWADFCTEKPRKIFVVVVPLSPVNQGLKYESQNRWESYWCRCSLCQICPVPMLVGFFFCRLPFRPSLHLGWTFATGEKWVFLSSLLRKRRKRKRRRTVTFPFQILTRARDKQILLLFLFPRIH